MIALVRFGVLRGATLNTVFLQLWLSCSFVVEFCCGEMLLNTPLAQIMSPFKDLLK